MRQRFLHLEAQNASVHKKLRGGQDGKEAFAQTYDITWIFHENGLEGCVLTYPEIRSAVDNQVISDVSLLPTYRDIKAQKTCIDRMRERAQEGAAAIDAAWLAGLHAHLLGPGATAAGAFRRDVPIHRTYFHAIVPPDEIEQTLEEALAYARTGPDFDLHPIELAARSHFRFMHAFPFSQHSGFLGRLTMNHVLARAHFLPCIIHASERQRYYEALRGPEDVFVGFFVEAMGNSLDNALRFLEGSYAAGPRRAVP